MTRLSFKAIGIRFWIPSALCLEAFHETLEGRRPRRPVWGGQRKRNGGEDAPAPVHDHYARPELEVEAFRAPATIHVFFGLPRRSMRFLGPKIKWKIQVIFACAARRHVREEPRQGRSQRQLGFLGLALRQPGHLRNGGGAGRHREPFKPRR